MVRPVKTGITVGTWDDVTWARCATTACKAKFLDRKNPRKTLPCIRITAHMPPPHLRASFWFHAARNYPFKQIYLWSLIMTGVRILPLPMQVVTTCCRCFATTISSQLTVISGAKCIKWRVRIAQCTNSSTRVQDMWWFFCPHGHSQSTRK